LVEHKWSEHAKERAHQRFLGVDLDALLKMHRAIGCGASGYLRNAAIAARVGGNAIQKSTTYHFDAEFKPAPQSGKSE
jgi:hypothetical protein